MPVFNYRGVDNSGRSIAGSMTADSEVNLEEKLRSSGCWLLDAKADRIVVTAESSPARWRGLPWQGGAKRRDLIEFCTLMGFQTKAGTTLVQALKVAAQDCENPRFKKTLQSLAQDLEAGLLFHQALEKYPASFAPNFVSMVRAGEMSAKLPETFEDLREYLEWVDTIVADLRQASLYPAIVLTVVSGFVLFLFSFIIPKFAILLASTNAELPLVTKIIFGASDFAKKTWWMWLLALFLLTLGVRLGCKFSKRFALWVDGVKLKLPIFGELNLMLAISRFTHNLAILYRSGIAIVQSLKLSESLVGNVLVENAVAEVRLAVEAGESISEALRQKPVFPTLLVRMVVMGETSGNLDQALQNVADYYNQIIPRRIKKLFTILEPALMLFLIGLVGTVALSIFLPILSLMNAIK